MRNDERFMRMALALAEKGRGKVEPNPMVGAVIVKGGKVTGRGYHRRFGRAHAEVNAIRDAGRRVKGATLYVTLEPCTTRGKTPPCTDAIIAAGLAKVVVASSDPTQADARRILRRAGIEMVFGPCRTEADELNAPFFKLRLLGLPYVTAKWAMTLDGRIATRTGDSKWISCEASRRMVHELRSQADAIMVGIGTVLQDDPELTARTPRGRDPRRIILDSCARIPLTSKIVRTARDVETIIATTRAAGRRKTAALKKAGCEVLVLPKRKGGVDLQRMMTVLGERELGHVLVEGGAKALTSMLDAGLIDRVWVFIAPKLIGGEGARSPVLGKGSNAMADALGLKNPETLPVGCDVLVRGRIHTVGDFRRRGD
ncbi:MAG: bifunctional diaminohydroxyphosphoribosylaminopyrimidine deaminase/5-amino-6-(5-phosphoribosylamino)uracil reductase RibD [Planctomycetes bacterium]|nr:bifunctional diaminohydroxyphosphoribosylaminopyrimidine deaminase/5-amino-6-(5-phosphoribosylamino)uracil reductase RibD [Planctomycetota bacterium]